MKSILSLLLLAVAIVAQRNDVCYNREEVSRAIEECENATRNEGGRWPFGGGRWPFGEGQGPFGGGRWPFGEGQGPFNGDRPFGGGRWPFNGDNAGEWFGNLNEMFGNMFGGRRPPSNDLENPQAESGFEYRQFGGRPGRGPGGRPDGGRPGGRPDGGRPGGWPFPGFPFPNFPFPGFGQRRNCGTEAFTGVRNNSAIIDFDSVKQNLGRVANPDKLADLQSAVDRCRTAYQTLDANSDNIRQKNREYNQCFMREVREGCRRQQPATQQPGSGGNPDNGRNPDNGGNTPGGK